MDTVLCKREQAPGCAQDRGFPLSSPYCATVSIRRPRYPKFEWGLTLLNRNPRDLLDAPAESGVGALAAVIPEGMGLFVDELIDISRRHFPELMPMDFFQKLLDDPDVQIPPQEPRLERIRLLPSWVAYECLRNAVAAKFPASARAESA